MTPTRQYLSIRPCSRRYRMWDIAPRQFFSIPLSSPKYGIWDMPPTCQYLSIRPFSRRYRICDIAPRPCLSIPLCNPELLISYASVSIHPPLQPQISDMGYRPMSVSIYTPSPKYRIWDMPPTRQYLSIRPFSRRYRTWEYWMLPHVSMYFPARNIGCRICPLRGSIYLSAPTAADIGYRILPHVRCLSILTLFQPRNLDMG